MIEPYVEGARTLASIATEADITLRTAQRWVERYRRDGLASLARRERVDEGTRRVISDRMPETIEGPRAGEATNTHHCALSRVEGVCR